MTARWLERLEPPAAGREDWYDTILTGLGLRVNQTGSKTWFVFFRLPGDPTKRRATLGAFPSLSLADARDAGRVVLLEAKRGKDPNAAKAEERGAPSFAEVAEEYLARHAASKRSGPEDRRVIEHDLLPVWGRRKANDIRRRDVIGLLDAIKDRGAPIQANRTLALVRKIFNWAIERDLLEANPCAQVKRVAPENQRDRVLTEEEIRKVWAAFENLAVIEHDPLKHPRKVADSEARTAERMSVMFKVRLLTAQRGGEVETMKWADLDLPGHMWTIPGAFAKNGHSHRVPLSASAVKLLEALPRTDEWCFPSPTRKGQHIANIQKAAMRVQMASGVDFVMHDLRRTAASLMTGMGIPRLVVSKILNHAEAGVTRVYDRHGYDSEKRQALESWAKRLDEILAGKPTKIRDLASARKTEASKQGAAQ